MAVSKNSFNTDTRKQIELLLCRSMFIASRYVSRSFQSVMLN